MTEAQISLPEKNSEEQKQKRQAVELPPYDLDSNGVAQLDLGVCSVSKAVDVAQRLMGQNLPFQIHFVKRQDEHCHILEHTVDQPEFMTDANGKKWKRVYS
jgi:hypothetical protein